MGKSGLELLPEHIFVEIFRMLSIKDIIRAQRINKFFSSLFKEFPMLLFNSLRGLYLSPFFPTEVCPTYHSIKRIYSRINSSKILMLEMFSYYTNGGYTKSDPYDSMINVFSSKLFDKCYTSMRENNILIKALFCGGRFHYSIDRSDWEKKGIRDIKGISSYEIELTELKMKLERVLMNTCKEIMIFGFCIEKPSFMNKSSFRTCAIFSSLYELKDLSVVESFHFVNEVEMVDRVAEALGIGIRTVKGEENTVVYFSETKLPARPLLWIQFTDRNIGTDILSLEVDAKYLGSYLYILFIDGFFPCASGLNVGTFITQGKILNLYE